MYLYSQQLINEIAVDEPDPAAANALQEGLGGQFGEVDAAQHAERGIGSRQQTSEGHEQHRDRDEDGDHSLGRRVTSVSDRPG